MLWNSYKDIMFVEDIMSLCYCLAEITSGAIMWTLLLLGLRDAIMQKGRFGVLKWIELCESSV